MRARCPPAGGQAGRRGDGLREVGDEDRGQVSGADRAALVDRQADHHRLGDAVQDGPQHDRERRAALLGTLRVLAVRAAETVDEPVAAEEDPAAGEDAGDGGPLPHLRVDRLLDEIEGDGADQHACAEAHDQPDRAQADSKSQRDDGADDDDAPRASPSPARPPASTTPPRDRRSTSPRPSLDPQGILRPEMSTARSSSLPI